jgi:hypothetical protein
VTNFEAEADIVVVGGGGGGLPSALFSRWLGNEVILLEKAPELGGTARKAAFWYWVPNNEPIRALGIKDEEEDCLRYMARLSRPQAYDPDSPTLGLSQWEYDLCKAIYESASPAAELLREHDALVYRHCADVPDYWAELPVRQPARPPGRQRKAPVERTATHLLSVGPLHGRVPESRAGAGLGPAVAGSLREHRVRAADRAAGNRRLPRDQRRDP